MLIKAFEIIFSIFTVYGIYTFIHDLMDILTNAVRKREEKRIEKEKRKESEDENDAQRYHDRRK